ncbi:hypothetical protein BJP36_37705 [Moorena producens JHB]|uniref:Uncharacterized protein n=1 Tax=Moorena producens (strain JHB) TaxID=1454205 RepID=A0A9Q9SUD4_MOOP1|nr:hypothetical protein [Moorena producens]WAN69832.1 hypothetical protein BJP36_37705 [Moorena producens JHB]
MLACLLPIACSRLPTPSVRFPHLIIKFATGRTAPDSRLPHSHNHGI